MITILRRNQRWLLFIVAIMTIVAFAWLYNRTDMEKLGANQVAQMYGKTIFQVDIDRAIRLQQLAAILGMNEFLGQLSSTARSQENVLEEFVWNLFILRHESDALWIRPSDEQVLQTIKSLPSLCSNGTFDRSRYLALLQEQLAPRGLTERHIEGLIRDSISLKMLRSLVVSPLSITPAETQENLRYFQRADASLIRIPSLNPKDQPQIPALEISAFYEKNRAQIVSPTLRSVEVAEFTLSGNLTALEGKSKVEALQKLANTVSLLHDNLTAPNANFKELTEKAGAKVFQTPLFDGQGLTAGTTPADQGPAVDLPKSVIAEAFHLPANQSVSEIIQNGNSFYILRKTQEVPSRPLTLEEVRPKIEEMLSKNKIDESQKIQAEGFKTSISKALAAGTAFPAATSALHLNAEELTGLEPWVQTSDARAIYARAAAALKEGEIGSLERDSTGYYFLYLNKRHPIDPAQQAARKAEIDSELLDSKQMLLFIEWLRLARQKSDLRFFNTRQ